ncbi:MAG: P27 family phage terminase small subunit [Bacteroidaceae bacterium]|nr:P27 family phage terminase small subunit [Paludibacteraceae bacterium]MBQ7056598.1 P27 family phage terminase small subunit [Bacteroidaceae bacterium]
MTKKQEENAANIRTTMQKAGIYEERFEFQIAEAAQTMEEMEAMRRIIKKEGRVVEEVKTGGVGTKKDAHPLVVQLNQLKRTFIQELAALGLNKMSEKKAEAKARKTEEDAFTQHLQAITE